MHHLAHCLPAGAGTLLQRWPMREWLTALSSRTTHGATASGAYLAVRTVSEDTAEDAMREGVLGHGSAADGSTIIDDTLLDNDELRSLLGVKPAQKAVLPGPHPCSICCTLFSLFGAAFLVRACGSCSARRAPSHPTCFHLPQFLIYNMLENDYEYLEVPGDRKAAAAGTMGAAITYLVTAAVSIAFWVRGCSVRSAAEAAQTPPAGDQDGTAAFLGGADARASHYSQGGLLGDSTGL